jgi:hypothetical protein
VAVARSTARSAAGLLFRVVRNWRAPLLIGLSFVLAVAGTFFFAYRAGRQAHRLRMENEPIRPWMSVPFIAHTHHVPASQLFAAIGVQPREPHDRRSIRHLARDLHRPMPELMTQLQRALDAAKKQGAHSP